MTNGYFPLCSVRLIESIFAFGIRKIMGLFAVDTLNFETKFSTFDWSFS